MLDASLTHRSPCEYYIGLVLGENPGILGAGPGAWVALGTSILQASLL